MTARCVYCEDLGYCVVQLGTRPAVHVVQACDCARAPAAYPLWRRYTTDTSGRRCAACKLPLTVGTPEWSAGAAFRRFHLECPTEPAAVAVGAFHGNPDERTPPDVALHRLAQLRQKAGRR